MRKGVLIILTVLIVASVITASYIVFIQKPSELTPATPPTSTPETPPTQSPTPITPEVPTPVPATGSGIGDFSIAVSKVDRQEGITTLYFAITKVTDTDSEGSDLKVMLTDDHGNQYQGILSDTLCGASLGVIPLLPVGFTYVDSVNITIPQVATIETIRFGEGPEIGFKDLQFIEPSFKQDFGEMMLESGSSVSLGNYLKFTSEVPNGDAIGWTLPVTVANTEYNPLPVKIEVGVQFPVKDGLGFPAGRVLWVEAAENVTGSGQVLLKPSILPVGLPLNGHWPFRILITFADVSTGQKLLRIIPITTDQFPPLPERIVFITTGGIYVMNVDGSSRTWLAEGSNNPVTSPDGKKIAFEGKGYGYVDIYVMNPDGSGLVKLAKGREPVWSPDGTKIAFEYFGIWIMNADGSGQTALIPKDSELEWSNQDFVWSPDGTKIAFESGYPGKIYIMNADGSDITHLGDVDGYDPSWSPDGQKIAFKPAWVGQGISIVNVDGSGEMEISEGDESPVWSPDGKKIVYGTKGAMIIDRYIYVMNADGSGEIALEKGESPAWSPDGSRIAFTSNHVIYLVNVDGSGLVSLGAGETPAWAVGFKPGA